MDTEDISPYQLADSGFGASATSRSSNLALGTERAQRHDCLSLIPDPDTTRTTVIMCCKHNVTGYTIRVHVDSQAHHETRVGAVGVHSCSP